MPQCKSPGRGWARSRDILTGVYGTTNLRKLGDHGFTVDDTPRAAKPVKKVPTA